MRKLNVNEFDQISGGTAFVLCQINGPGTVTSSAGTQTFFGTPTLAPVSASAGDYLACIGGIGAAVTTEGASAIFGAGAAAGACIPVAKAVGYQATRTPPTVTGCTLNSKICAR